MEYKTGLFLFYIIVMGPYFEKILNCDLQRFMETSVYGRHVVAFLTAFFAIVLTEYGNDDEAELSTIWDYFKTTVIIYILFIFSTKSKAIFVFPLLILLAVDQILKVYTTKIEKKQLKANERDKHVVQSSIDYVEQVRSVLSYVILGIIGVGSFSYFIRQRQEFGSNFSLATFFLGTFKCQGILHN